MGEVPSFAPGKDRPPLSEDKKARGRIQTYEKKCTVLPKNTCLKFLYAVKYEYCWGISNKGPQKMTFISIKKLILTVFPL